MVIEYDDDGNIDKAGSDDDDLRAFMTARALYGKYRAALDKVNAVVVVVESLPLDAHNRKMVIANKKKSICNSLEKSKGYKTDAIQTLFSIDFIADLFDDDVE